MRCVIVAGADIQNYDYVISQLTDEDCFIYCDSGLRHREFLPKPNLIVGDFDSFALDKSEIETIVLPMEKDDTDSVYAIKEALKRGFKDILLLGVVGNRLDHTLANLGALEYIYKHDAKGKIIDNYSEMEIVDSNVKEIDNKYAYFSLLNIYGEVMGINISGAKYNLYDATIKTDYQYAISNEVKGDAARVSVDNGILLLIKILR